MKGNIDLHAIANTPGFGKAEKAIKEAGYWNEKAVPRLDGKHTYTVRIEAEATVTAYLEIEVDAASKDEAKKKALSEAKSTTSWDWEIDASSVDVDTLLCEVTELTKEGEK